MEDIILKKMVKIGRGWQYDVFDLGNYVLKIPHSREKMREIILENGKYNEKELNFFLNKTINDRKISIDGIRKRKIDRSLLSDLLIFNDDICLQKKVKPKGMIIKNYLDAGNIEKAIKSIDSQVNFNTTCWKNGFSEASYSFTLNNGENYNEKTVLIDFGHITFSKEITANKIKEKKWLKSWSYRKDFDDCLKEYYRIQMEKEITLENLDKYWKEAPLR